VGNVNDVPVGEVVIDGERVEGKIISANVEAVQDPDGLGVFSYQWLREGEEIEGATFNEHRLTQADVSANISVRVDYVDQYGMAEIVTSSQTQPIEDVPGVYASFTGRDGRELTGNVSWSLSQTETLPVGTELFDVLAGLSLRIKSIENGVATLSVLAKPEVASSAAQFTIAGEGISGLVASNAVAGWQVLTSATQFAAIGDPSGSNALRAGVPVEIATFSAAMPLSVGLASISVGARTYTQLNYDAVSRVYGDSDIDKSGGSVAILDADASDLEVDPSGVIPSQTPQLTAEDAFQALRLAVGHRPQGRETDAFDFISADMNRDGRVGADDALAILQASIGFGSFRSEWVLVEKTTDLATVGRGNVFWNTFNPVIGKLSEDVSSDFVLVGIGDVNNSDWI